MNLQVLYVTFARDLHWTRYSLESLYKFGSGISGVTVVVPTNDVGLFTQFTRYSTPECPVTIKGFLEYPGKGFVHHLAMKCYADVLCPGADYILHMDPDCLFIADFGPDDYLGDEKLISGTFDPSPYDGSFRTPILVIEPYEVLKNTHPARYNWKKVTEFALGFEVSHETMCRHPAVHHSWLYKAMREHVEKVHGTPFLDFVLKQKNSYPQGFGEFNTLGAYAFEKHPDVYHFLDRKDKGVDADPTPKVWQGWSYTGVTHGKNAEKIKEVLG